MGLDRSTPPPWGTPRPGAPAPLSALAAPPPVALNVGAPATWQTGTPGQFPPPQFGEPYRHAAERNYGPGLPTFERPRGPLPSARGNPLRGPLAGVGRFGRGGF